MDKIKKSLLDDCREYLVLAVGSAAGAGEHETAARINAILIDIDIACEMCYTGKNTRKSRENEEDTKMDKIKIWSVCVNHVTWDSPQTLYFNSKDAAEECYSHFEYADKPQYVGAYSPRKVAAAVDTNPADVSPEIELLYYRSYAEYIGYNK